MSCECHVMWVTCHVVATSCECHSMWMPRRDGVSTMWCVPCDVCAVSRERHAMRVPCDASAM